MRNIIARVCDNYGLFNFHKNYSKETQFYYDENQVLDFNSDYLKFYAKPNLPQIFFEENRFEEEYSYGKLKFLSEVDNEECNKYAIVNYKRNEKDKNNVILIHGWCSESFHNLDKIFLKSFLKRKYNIYNYILPFHMDRCPKESLYSGEYFLSANVNRTLKSVQQSVSDIRALISYIKQNSKGKVILIGLSLGGQVANLVAETEKDLDLLISLFYANDLSYTIHNSVPGKYIKKDLNKNHFNEDMLNNSWRIINPTLRKPLINKEKILLISGKYDKYVLEDDTNKLWEGWNRPERHNYDCGHSGIVLCRKKIKNDTLRFIDNYD
ncbi:alpha/beta hydrolase [Clostridium polyendosporum]|uniref:Alpha/beta hydrolase n=1 Tax=Clostridium polyendosporum TaxID=69208 RepID=A0A919VHI7_9CLOT|nr:alpha/beta hydrolase [Clostridium polyendosporum]GIM30435.1 alpha/beta hydrolase [Clostridium polyendosporum]